MLQKSPPPSLTASFAQYWSGARYEDLAPEVVARAKRHLLDTIAAGLAGARTDVVDATAGAMRRALEGATGSAVLWGRGESLPAPQAALVNGTAAHARELDDFGGCGHSGAVVVPAVAAIADREGIGGAATLVALVAGYDAAGRVTEGAGGYRPHNNRGWHSTGTCGSFGAAAGAAKVLGLDAERYTSALGIAGTFTGGIWAYLVDGAMTKRFHPGKAAENGLSAALLAEAGMTGPRFVLEAEWGGFFSTYCGEDAKPEAITAGLGRDFKILGSGIKPYACCRGIHAPLDELFHLMAAHGFGADAIAAMVVHGSAQTRRQLGGRRIESVLDAQFSIPYSLAAAAVSGRATLDQFSPPIRGNPAIDRLMAETEVVADRELKGMETPSLEIRLADGRRFEHHVPFAKGAPENPVSDADVEAKAASLIAPIFGEPRYREILNTIRELEHLADFRDLTRLLRSDIA
jgi:2-methylcitrate dehydratase PrpD